MVKLEEHKHLTENKPIEKAELPSKVFIPLLQHLGKPLDLIKVKAGDDVKRGTLLATSDKGLFAPVHASISGKVTTIADYPHPVSGFARAIAIEGDGKDEACPDMAPRSEEEAAALTADALKKIIFEAGIVGLGGATFPTHIKLSPSKPIEDFILNGAECEPYLTCDYRLMVERADEIIKGMKLVTNILKPRSCYIAIEDNKPEAIKLMQERARMFNWEVVVLATAYPQGGEKQVIKSCIGTEVPSGKLPFDIGVVVHNVATVYAIYEAVYLKKPLYERAVTVSGSCLANPKNLLARIGTPVKDLIGQCGPLVKEPKKIIMGGPMMGIAQYTMDGPVIKGTSGIILLDEIQEREQEETFCVRCGECVQNCPMGLNPGLIALAISKDKLELAEEYGIMDCIECGLCAYLCPSRRNIVQAIKAAKLRIRDAKK
ncbi:MAG: electron transport complex subunit RsxC [Candidatus Omnitrophica bacterium]|nr:electron transport complex subunit RsxC [Candidatus Omnitrophota bacterium]